MLFCTCATQVYEITKNIKTNVCYSVPVPHKFMRSPKALKLMYGILYMCHTSLWDHQTIKLMYVILYVCHRGLWNC